MAKVNIEEVVNILDREIRKALDATIRAHFSNQEYNSREVFKTFKKEIGNKCNAWERVPNKYIRPE